MIPRSSPEATLVFGTFFPRISRRYPIVSLSLRRRFERSAPFSFHSRASGIALSSLRLLHLRRVNSRRARKEEPFRKRASCCERVRWKEGEEGIEKKKKEREKDLAIGEDSKVALRRDDVKYPRIIWAGYKGCPEG